MYGGPQSLLSQVGLLGLALAALLFAPTREVFAVELNVLAAGAGGRTGRPVSRGLATHDDVHRDSARAHTASRRCGGVPAVSDQPARAGAIQAARLRGAGSMRI